MNERFLEIKKSIDEKLCGLLKCVLDTPPSYEEVIGTFRHGKRCSETKELVKEEFEQIVSFSNGLGMITRAIPVSVKYVKCPECHASERYSD